MQCRQYDYLAGHIYKYIYIYSWLLSTVASFVKYNHTHHMNSSLRRKRLVDTCTPHRTPLFYIARCLEPGIALQYALPTLYQDCASLQNSLHYEIVSILLLVFMMNGTAPQRLF
jgi:hypothetical protein